MEFIQKISALATSFLLAYIAYITNRKNQLQIQLNDKKRVMYERFIDILIDAMMNTHHQDITNNEEFRERMFDFKKNFILFASPHSIKAFNKWTNDSSNKNTRAIFENVENLVKCLREEIGLSNRGLGKYDVLQILIKNNLKDTKLFDKKKKDII